MSFQRLLGVIWAVAFGAVVALPAQAQINHAPKYRLGTGDAIRITVFQNPDLTLETRVGGDGSITYPLVGTVKIGGKTIDQAEKAIASALQAGRFIKHPQVSIFVTQVRSRQVSILGEVGKPGQYPLESLDIRVSTAIAMAGGIAPDGADVVILTGMRNKRPFRKEIDIPGLFLQRDSIDDILVAAGDSIYVPRAPMFYIYGEVQRAGSYRVVRAMTMRQALVQGGGLTPRGTEKGLRVYREAPDGKVVALTPHLDDLVQPGDVLRVGESLF